MSCIALQIIRTFKSKGLRRFAQTGDISKLKVQKPARIRAMLASLDAAVAPEDMNLPGYGFHELQGKRAGDYAVSVSGNWRITFAWDGVDAVDVDLEDYH